MHYIESDILELKSSFGKGVIETLSAFANTKGGKVVIGINDHGFIQGITLGPESIPQWSNEVKQQTAPSIIPDVEIKNIAGKTIVEFSIDEFPVKPVAFKGRYFKRVENSNHQLDINEITNLNMQSLQLSWDAYENQEISLEDLDFDKVKSFINRVNAGGRFSLSDDPLIALHKLKLVVNGKPTNAAMLLFNKEDIPNNVHIGRFKTPSHIIDDKMIR